MNVISRTRSALVTAGLALGLLTLSLLCLDLSGCASLGLAPATGAQEQLAYAYAGVTAALNTLASATSSGVVSSAEATTVNADILAVKSALDTANAAMSTNEPAAVQAITAATATLATISSYLACEQAKEASCPPP
jgi:hypothetical protein